MNRNKMSIIIVSLTIITVFIMALTSHFRKSVDTDDYKTLILNNEIHSVPTKGLDLGNNKNTNNVINNNLNSNIHNKEDENIKGPINKNSKQFSIDLSNNMEGKENSPIEKINDSDTYESYSDNKKNINQDNYNSEAVFKVSKEKIPSELSISDKIKILSISKNLSPGDLNKIQDDINSNDEKEGISDAIHILKTRLDSKDFNNIKDIASKFINFDSIND